MQGITMSIKKAMLTFWWIPFLAFTCNLEGYSLLNNENLAELQTLFANGVDINKPGINGLTYLHIAAHRLSLDTVKFLLKEGADIQKKDVWGRRALEAAIEGKDFSNVIYLLEQSPNTNFSLVRSVMDTPDVELWNELPSW